MTVHLESEIASVTVFRQGAQVSRVTRIALEPGAASRRWVIGGLPLCLIDASVRVELMLDSDQGEGLTGLPRVIQTRVGLAPASEVLEKPTKDTEVELAQREEGRLSAEVQQRGREIERWQALVPPPRNAPAEGAPPCPSPFAARRRLVELRERRLRELGAVLREKERQLRRATERRQHLEDREKRGSSASREPRTHELRKTVAIDFEPVEQALSLRVTLSYRVPGPRWAPAYVLELERGGRRANLALRAQVRQATGEDWGRVQLTLSTADPQPFVRLPELNSLRIGRTQAPVARTGYRPPAIGAEALFEDYDRVCRRWRPPEPKPVAAPEPPSEVRELPNPEPLPVALAASPLMPQVYTASNLAPIRGVFKGGGVLSALGQLASVALPAPDYSSDLATRERKVARKALVAPSAVAGGFAPPRSASYGAMPALGEQQPKVPSFGLAEELLDYGQLRLPPASSSLRGQLRCIQREEFYMELLSEQTVVFSEIAPVLESATEQAHQIALAPAPRGHCFADSQDGFFHAYVADAPVDVPSDGEHHLIPIMARVAALVPYYVGVPREVREVFRMVDLDNPLEGPLLEGPCDIYQVGEYLSTTRIPTTPVQGKLSVGLGVEPAIRVARNTEFVEKRSGILRGSLDLIHRVQLEVANHLSEPALIEIRERMPLVREDEEQVELVLEPSTTKWEAYQLPGVPTKSTRRWRGEIASGQSLGLDLAYTIRISSKYELLGGNRREA